MTERKFVECGSPFSTQIFFNSLLGLQSSEFVGDCLQLFVNYQCISGSHDTPVKYQGVGVNTHSGSHIRRPE